MRTQARVATPEAEAAAAAPGATPRAFQPRMLTRGASDVHSASSARDVADDLLTPGDRRESNASSQRSAPLRWEDRPAALPRVQVDEVLLAARHLPTRERALIDGVYRRGMSVRAMSQATGMPQHRLRRRLRSIVRRLRGPVFRYVLRECMLENPAARSREHAAPPQRHGVHSLHGIPAPQRGVTASQRSAIARRIVLERCPQRIVARELNLTVHQVRRELERIRTLAEQG